MNWYSVCTAKEDEIMQDQSIWQIILSDQEYYSNPIFKDFRIELSCELRNLFGLDEMYIYQLNFSSN